jgi:hypothetical protein
MLFSCSSKSSYMYIISGIETDHFLSIYVFLLKSRRWISLHEYQSKKILNENNLNVQRFQVVDNPQDAKRAGEELSKNKFFFIRKYKYSF